MKSLDTLFDLETAARLFKRLAAREDIAYGYALDGCWARSYLMCQLTQTMPDMPNLEQVWAFPKGFYRPENKRFESHLLNYNKDKKLKVESVVQGGFVRQAPIHWNFHVAPIGWLRLRNELVRVVFDPSLFDGPVLLAQWLGVMRAKQADIIVTNAHSLIDVDHLYIDPEHINLSDKGRLEIARDLPNHIQENHILIEAQAMPTAPDIVDICLSKNPKEGLFMLHSLRFRQAQVRDLERYFKLMRHFSKTLSPHPAYLRQSTILI